MLKSGVHATISGVLLAFAIPFRKDDEKNISNLTEKFLDKPAAFFILPLFALANTAIVIPSDIISNITSSNSLGIITGLVLGNPAGIFLFSYLAVKTGMGILPESLNWKWMIGAGCLAGIGFTMSIFITNLAFNSSEIVTASKLSIILASIISAVIGLIILKLNISRIDQT